MIRKVEPVCNIFMNRYQNNPQSGYQPSRDQKTFDNKKPNPPKGGSAQQDS